jgi:hypothetical protein
VNPCRDSHNYRIDRDSKEGHGANHLKGHIRVKFDGILRSCDSLPVARIEDTPTPSLDSKNRQEIPEDECDACSEKMSKHLKGRAKPGVRQAIYRPDVLGALAAFLLRNNCECARHSHGERNKRDSSEVIRKARKNRRIRITCSKAGVTPFFHPCKASLALSVTHE